MTDEQKIDILDDFALRVKNVEMEPESSCERTEYMVGLVYEVITQILNLLLVLVMFWKLFDFIEKHKKKLEMWFF